MIAVQRIMIGVRTVLLGSAGGIFFPSTLYTSVNLLEFSYMVPYTLPGYKIDTVRPSTGLR